MVGLFTGSVFQDWAFTVKASGCGSLQFCDMLRFSNRMVDEARWAKRVGSVHRQAARQAKHLDDSALGRLGR